MTGLATLPRAFLLILSSRPLVWLSFGVVLLPLVFCASVLGFYHLVIAPPRASVGGGALTAGIVLLMLALLTLPISGPAAHAVQRRAQQLAQAALAGKQAPRWGAFVWLAEIVGGLQHLFARLYLTIAAGIMAALFLLPLRLSGDVYLHALFLVQGFVTVGLASALVYLMGDEVAAKTPRSAITQALRRFPRFVGYFLGVALLTSFPLIQIFQPTLGSVAGVLWLATLEEAP